MKTVFIQLFSILLSSVGPTVVCHNLSTNSTNVILTTPKVPKQLTYLLTLTINGSPQNFGLTVSGAN